MIVNSPDGLPTKRQLFVNYYIQLNGNATQAAIKAGYSPKTAYSIGERLLRNIKVQAALASRTAQLENEQTATTQEVLEYLASVMRGEAVEEVVVNVGTGKGYTNPEKVKAQVSAKDRLKAAEMLAKVKGLFITKAELDVQGAIPL